MQLLRDKMMTLDLIYKFKNAFRFPFESLNLSYYTLIVYANIIQGGIKLKIHI